MWYDADSNSGRLLKYVSRKTQKSGVKIKYAKQSNTLQFEHFSIVVKIVSD